MLDPNNFQDFPISEKKVTSHNTAIYRFKLPTENSILGLPIGQHISLAANLDVKDDKTGEVKNQQVVRSYTPISSDVHPGYFDLMIKSYPTGNISRHLGTLKVGDSMKVRGPKGAMVYTPNMVREFGMIAGGTGITPMLQIIRAIQRGRSSGDKTKVTLIFANVDEKDILLKDEIEELDKNDSQFKVYYALNNPPEKWNGGVGFVTADMIKVSRHFGLLNGVVADDLNYRNICLRQRRTSRSLCAVRHLWSARSRKLPSRSATIKHDRSAR